MVANKTPINEVGNIISAHLSNVDSKIAYAVRPS